MHLSLRLHIDPSDLVLEIGGGGLPHPRSDVLVDKYLEDDGFDQRGRAPLVKAGKPLVQADGAQLCFEDDAFDYVICSHVLEHIPEADVQRFLQEIQRVSHGGYLETPSFLYEYLFDLKEHTWIVAYHEGTLLLQRKTDQSRFHAPARAALRGLLAHSPEMFHLTQMNAELFFVGFEWARPLRYRILKSHEKLPVPGEEEVYGQLVREQQSRRRRLRLYVRQIALDFLSDRWTERIRSLKRNRRETPTRKRPLDWQALLRCPRCRGRLHFSSDSMICERCNVTYRYAGDVPVLL